jgi:DnaK suppressor protein
MATDVVGPLEEVDVMTTNKAPATTVAHNGNQADPSAKKAPAAKKVTATKVSATKVSATKAVATKPATKKPAAAASTPTKSTATTSAPKKTTAPPTKAAKPPVTKTEPAVKKTAPRSTAPTPSTPSPPIPRSTTVRKALGAPIGPLPPLKEPTAGPYAKEPAFLEEQRSLLTEERSVYQGQAEDLRAEADSLAQEREPGDVQFDEESGEGGTVAVDRERDLALSAQALGAVEEIDDALRRIDRKTYGACERCHQPIPKARLRALPYARLCVACKSGGLSRR